MVKISPRASRRMGEQNRLQKKLLGKVEKGKIGAADAEKILRQRGFEISPSFNSKLLESQRKFLMSSPLFVKGLKRFEEEKEERIKRKREEEEERRREQFEGFKSAFKLMKRGDLTVDEFSKYAEELYKNNFRSEIKLRNGSVLKWDELSDYERFKLNRRFFNDALALFEKGKINRLEAIKIANALGLRDARDWWAKYYQKHPDRKRNPLKRFLRK